MGQRLAVSFQDSEKLVYYFGRMLPTFGIGKPLNDSDTMLKKLAVIFIVRCGAARDGPPVDAGGFVVWGAQTGRKGLRRGGRGLRRGAGVSGGAQGQHGSSSAGQHEQQGQHGSTSSRGQGAPAGGRATRPGRNRGVRQKVTRQRSRAVKSSHRRAVGCALAIV